MNFLLWVIFGGLAGWIASMIVGADSQLGLLGNIIVGIVGAFIGGWIADRMGSGGTPGAARPSTLKNFVIATVGSVIFLLLLNLIW